MPPAGHSAHRKRTHAISRHRPALDARAPAGGCGPGPSRSPGVLGAPFDNLLAILLGLHPDAPGNKFGCAPDAMKGLSSEATSS